MLHRQIFISFVKLLDPTYEYVPDRKNSAQPVKDPLMSDENNLIYTNKFLNLEIVS